MTIFLDTDFTELAIDPRLLSIGMVAAAKVDSAVGSKARSA